MIPGIDRVYVNDRARAELGWQPRHDFRALMARLRAGEDIRSPSRARSAARADRDLREPFRNDMRRSGNDPDGLRHPSDELSCQPDRLS